MSQSTFFIKNTAILYQKYTKTVRKWTCVNCVRTKSSAEPKTKAYSHTILAPKTNFPTRSNNAKKEEIQKVAQFSELYNWQRKNLTGPEFVLHDGPPYANGDLHMGHAVNKIIKDINNRSQVLQGNKVHYVPGWDCHGLPIELKALQQVKKKTKKNEPSDPVQIREIARNFALETVQRQKEAFRSWGVMADWDNQCYLTLNKGYVQNQLRQFYKMYKSGLIFRALKPVYWSPSSKTALAEAELEYDPQFKSKEVYVAFPIENLPQAIQDAAKGQNVSAIIWTTTPWTLVANRAICYSPQLRYSLVTLSSRPENLFLVGSGLIEGLEKTLGAEITKVVEFGAFSYSPQLRYSLVTLSSRPGSLFLVGSGLIEGLERTLGAEITKVVEFGGQDLQGTTYRNKLVNETLPFLPGDHVTEGKGTGLVHTAPAHGPEDFLIALKNNMTVECNVDERGCYTNLDPELNGHHVLTTGQDLVVSRLGSAVVHQGWYVHSYPLDWRTKQPVIVRASQQWFIDTAALKDKALAALDSVEILPASSGDQSRAGFRAQLEKRPYWCISRQRAWGVPIPALYRGGEVIVEEHTIEKLCSLVDSKGPDVWWTCDVKELLPDDAQDPEGVTKGQDIMDIWYDSGISWTTLGDSRARLYCEGYDQLTGWFQAAMLTSIALRGEAPYQSIFVHGFVVDDKKRKMSKSIGNVIEPATIIHGGKDKNNHPAYGIDTLRWWVASHATQHAQIVISKKLLDDCQGEVIRIRNILKYLLGVVTDLEPGNFSQKPELNYLDQYMVEETHEFLKQINEHYNNFRYNYVAQSILYFISNKVSGLYCHCIKDRLYCSKKDSNERKSVQLTAHTILIALSKALGPILPHLIEEAWQHHPLFKDPFYYTKEIPMLPAQNIDVNLMDTILEIKRDVCVIAKNESLKKFNAKIKLESDLFDKFSRLNLTDGLNDSVLCEILELSKVDVEVINGGKKWLVELEDSKASQCLRCRKYNVLVESDKCLRCESVLNT